ncbi:MAG: DM13 domain-containing protein [Candidatus Peribacteraceae bacterium]|jgi:hypothetical protein
MRLGRLSLLFALLLPLAACTARPTTEVQSVRREDLMQNPLYAERYWDELTERMVDILLREKDTLDAGTLAAVDEVRREALQHAQEESLSKQGGKLGSFVSMKETVGGLAFLHGRTLSLSPDFLTSPGADLRLLLTTMLDPRDGVFPDETSVDIGRLESPYGAQEYLLPESVKTEELRTVAVFDARLKRLYGFAQLQ